MKNIRVILVALLCSLLATGNAFAAGAVTTATVSATVASTNSITLSTATFAFSSIAGSSTTYRYRNPANATNGVDVSYFAAGPYEIRVYTDNGVGAGYTDARGFIRDANTVAAHRLYPKIWCPNFSANAFIDTAKGPALAATSSITQYVWGGYNLNGDGNFDPDNPQVFTSGSFVESTIGQDINGDGDTGDTITATATSKVSEGPTYAYIRELDTHTEGDSVAAANTRCVLVCNTPGRGDKSLGNPFPVVFGLDLTGIANGTYTSVNNGPANPITTGQTCAAGVTFELLLY